MNSFFMTELLAMDSAIDLRPLSPNSATSPRKAKSVSRHRRTSQSWWTSRDLSRFVATHSGRFDVAGSSEALKNRRASNCAAA
jgi:hypothetical protein